MGWNELLVHSVLPTVDGGWHDSNLEKETGVPARKLSHVLLWRGAAAKHVLTSKKKQQISLTNLNWLLGSF